MFNVMDVELGLKGLQDAMNVHPLFVHFPIALLLTSFAVYLLGSLLKKDELLGAGKWLLYFGTLSAAVTVWAGLEAEKTVPHGGGVHETMLLHKYLGFSILALSLVLALWVFFSKTLIPKTRIAFLMGMAILCVIVTQSADLGGRMVFLHGVGVGRKSEMKEAVPHAHGKEHGGQSHDSHDDSGKEHGGDSHDDQEPGGHDHGGHSH